MSDGPTIKRGKSRQDYSTPMDFFDAVIDRFGYMAVDLAASCENSLCLDYITEEENSIIKPWHRIKGLLWLNPPFDRIEPWASKCREEAAQGARILFLTPASIGSNWFSEHVHRHAFVLALNGRLCFDGESPYPKDCILSCYGFGVGFDVWRWK